MQSNNEIAMTWSLRLIARAFNDLAISFGAIDAAAADRAIHEIEAMVVRELTALRQKRPEGITINDFNAIMQLVVPPLREMTQGARDQIRQTASKH